MPPPADRPRSGYTPPARRDWPAIKSRHPAWWHVERVERCGDQLRYVLIAETETEQAAFTVADRQASQTRITRWGDKRAPWLSFRPPREVTDE